MPWSSFSECWVLTQPFHSPLSPSSRDSLVSLLSAIRVVSSAYLRLLILLPAILISACDSSSLGFHMMYPAYKLNKHGDNIQSWHTLFPNSEPVCCSTSGSKCCFLTCIQISQEADKAAWYSHLFQNFPVCCDPNKGFNVVNEADVFWNSLAFSMIQWMLAIWSLVPLPFLNQAWASGSS